MGGLVGKPRTQHSTQQEFFVRAERQEGRYEFDGFRPGTVTSNDTPRLPEAANEIPVAERYHGIVFPDQEDSA